jgi:FkbM family methyltransferase
MSRVFRAVKMLDELGFRRLLAFALSVLLPGRRFAVDAAGRWINSQRDATIVSPSLHITPYQKIHSWVIENWCWDYQLKKGDVVIDIGAGIGEETVAFSKMVGPTGRVISIEAHPETFAALKATVERSNLDNVTILQCAVADKNGTIGIGTADCHVASSIFQGATISVPAKTLDSIIDELGICDIAFIKMNIEGAEKMAVTAMGATFGRLRATCISCHDFVADLRGVEDFRSKTEVRAALTGQGFSIRTRDDHPECWVRDYLYASRENSRNICEAEAPALKEHTPSDAASLSNDSPG